MENFGIAFLILVLLIALIKYFWEQENKKIALSLTKNKELRDSIEDFFELCGNLIIFILHSKTNGKFILLTIVHL